MHPQRVTFESSSIIYCALTTYIFTYIIQAFYIHYPPECPLKILWLYYALLLMNEEAGYKEAKFYFTMLTIYLRQTHDLKADLSLCVTVTTF